MLGPLGDTPANGAESGASRAPRGARKLLGHRVALGLAVAAVLIVIGVKTLLPASNSAGPSIGAFGSCERFVHESLFMPATSDDYETAVLNYQVLVQRAERTVTDKDALYVLRVAMDEVMTVWQEQGSDAATAHADQLWKMLCSMPPFRYAIEHRSR